MTDLSNKHLPLPEQTKGTQNDIQDRVRLLTKQEAHTFYAKAKSRLSDVNRWSALCGDASARFALTDGKGNRVEGSPQAGFYFKIDVPGPDAPSGEGFDGVRVEAINEQGDNNTDTEYIIRVRPASDPTTANENTAHFFSDKAASTFLVLRDRIEGITAVLGRNEVANTDEDDSLPDKRRNFVVGTGAKSGMADPQGKSLVEGIAGKGAGLYKTLPFLGQLCFSTKRNGEKIKIKT